MKINLKINFMGKDFWKEYFTFSKRERNAVHILLGIMAIFIVLPGFFRTEFKKPFVNQQLQKQLTALQKSAPGNSWPDSGINNSHEEINASVNDAENSRHLFYFDPNQLDAAGWKQLGLRDKTIQTIINYRSKGGHFKTPDDLRKIYGLHKDEADMLIPYIQIQSEKEQKTTSATYAEQSSQSRPGIKKIDINTATPEEWKALPGIGDVLSNRIVKFRNSMNGFKSVEDIRRTYGLSDSTFQLILPYLSIPDSTSNN